jgi:sugar lactone lactonase YvrE
MAIRQQLLGVLACALLPLTAIGGAADYQVEVFARGSPLRGVQGLAFGPDGALYAGSISGQAIYRVDIASGGLELVVTPPLGQADDLAVSANGDIAWTAIGDSAVRLRRPDGVTVEVAQGLLGVNGINFGPDGRLFVSTVVPPSKLWEIDTKGTRAPSLVMTIPGGLNGFEIDSKYRLYGPLPANGSVVEIDLKTKTVRVVSKGYVTPISVNLTPEHDIVSLGFSTGEVFRIDPESGERTLIVKLDPPVDNHAIAANGLIYVSRSADGQIVEVDPGSGSVRVVVAGRFTGPGGLSTAQVDGEEQLLVADLTGHRLIDLASGRVTRAETFINTLDRSRREFAGGTAAVVAGGLLYATNAQTNGVHVLNLATGEHDHSFRDILSPYDLAVLKDGRIAVAEFATGRILRLAQEREGAHEVIARGLKGPVGVATWGDTGLAVTEIYTGAVSKVSMIDGSVTRLVEGLDQPEGLAVDRDGGIVVAEVGARRLIRLDPRSGNIEVLAEELPIGATVWRLPAPAYLLTDVAVGPDGSIYLTSDRTNSILKLSLESIDRAATADNNQPKSIGRD